MMHPKALAALLFCLVLVACTASPLSRLEGKWAISIDDTVAMNENLQGNSTGDALAKAAVVTLLDGMSLDFDTANKTVSGRLVGLSFDRKNFGLVEEKGDSCTLLLMNSKITCTLRGNDKLEIRTEGESTILVFNKVKS